MLHNNKLYIYLLVVCSSLVALPATAAENPPAAAGSWLSILPPLAAIVIALTIKRVVPALFAGLVLGAWLVEGLTLGGLWGGLLASFEVYVLDALADRNHAAILLFSMMIGGMVGIISRNGGMQGVVNLIAGWADSARHAILATAAMGVAVFFDDYANTLVVGNTMRPITDARNVSRAKLAYIVDSTAAPVACIALVTTWIGYQVGLIGDSLQQMDGLDIDAYLLFINTIPYSFYPVLAVLFVFMVAWSGRDFGPMLESERRARLEGPQPSAHLADATDNDSGPIDPVADKPHRAINAVLPVAVLIVSVMVGLYVTGSANVAVQEPTLRDIVGSADSYKTLMWASFLSALVATVLSAAQRVLDMEEIVNAWYRGMRAMIMALIILVLAWALSATTEKLQTAQFLVSVLGDALPAFLLPTLVFVLAAATAFATGSSWGTMGILVPLVMPLSWAVLQAQGLASPEHYHLLFSSVAAVLAGSVWGDHCSPISDTTILSSLASGCDHIEHVRTQLPYAFAVGLAGLLCGSLPVALGMPWWLGMLAGAVALAVLLRLAGRHSEPGDP